MEKEGGEWEVKEEMIQPSVIGKWIVKIGGINCNCITEELYKLMMNLMNCKYVLINPTNYKACNIIFADSVIVVMYFYIVVWLFVCFVGNKNCLFELWLELKKKFVNHSPEWLIRVEKLQFVAKFPLES